MIDDAQHFLGEAEFSQRDEVIRAAAREIAGYGSSKGVRKIAADLEAINMFFRRNMTTRYAFGSTAGRDRTASETINSGYFMNCIDTGLVFTTLARELGIPAKHVESFARCDGNGFSMKFHAFTDVFTGDDWAPYDPGYGFTHDRRVYFSGAYVYEKLAEGMDFSELYLPCGGGPIKIMTRDHLARLALPRLG